LRTITNADIADRLLELAQYLGEERGNAFRAKAYRRAAKTIRGMGESFAELVRTDADLTRYPGIGEGIGRAIREIAETGTLRKVEALRAQATPERAALSQYPHLDPKRVLRVFRKLGISDIDELRRSLDSGELAERMGSRTAEYIRGGLAERNRILLYEADRVASEVEMFLLDRCRVARAEAAGDFRRRVETISELSFVVEARDFAAVCRRLGEYGGHADLIESDADSAAFRLPAGIVLKVRNTSAARWGSELALATGSESHLRELGRRGCDPKRVEFPDEESLYRACGMEFVPPELREGRVEAVPSLIGVGDLRGELHAHSTASDGRNTIGQMAVAARKRGYQYIGITDHSQSLKIAGGLSEEQLWEQIREIDQWNERLEGIRVLKSAEVDILADGSLDYPDELLRELDYTVCSIHSRFGLGKSAQTERVLRAMDNRYFTILGHATGRLLLRRPGYELDIERVIAHARECGCFFEINSSPDRLDLSADNARLAGEAGIRIAINTDAHGLRDFDLVRYGVDVARRAGLSRGLVLNALCWEELGPLFASRH
jgi:DNA polymerase (family 10)